MRCILPPIAQFEGERNVIDTHIHLDFFSDDELPALLKEARLNRVDGFVIPAASPRDWERLRSIADGHDGVRLAFGVHPWFAHEIASLEATKASLGTALTHPMVVAVGECGLDLTRADQVPLRVQEDTLRMQLTLASELSLPVILHAVRAVPLVSKAFADAALERGVLHGFVGSYETAKRGLDVGLRLGVGARALASEKTRETLRRVPLECLLVETDAPETRFRGAKRGLPRDLARVLSELAALRKEPREVVEECLATECAAFFSSREALRPARSAPA